LGNKFAYGPTAQATLMFHKIWKEWLSSFTSLDAIAPCCVVPHSHFTSHVIDIANLSSMIPKSSETLKSSEIEWASSKTFKSKCIDLYYVYVYAFQHTVEILSHSCSFSLCVLSLGLQNSEWVSILEILSPQVWDKFNSNFNKGVWFQHDLQNLVAFVTTCKREILWIYGHVFPVVILILGSLPHCVSSALYWTLNALGKVQGVDLLE
jgi:hypothetical protein